MGAKGMHANSQAQRSLEKLSAIAGITLDGSIHFRVHDGSIRSEQIIEYMEQLLRYIDGHIVPPLGRLQDAHLECHQEVPAGARRQDDSVQASAILTEVQPSRVALGRDQVCRMRGYCPKNSGELKRRLYSCVRSLRRKRSLVRSYFDASDLPVGPNEETKLCRYQITEKEHEPRAWLGWPVIPTAV